MLIHLREHFHLPRTRSGWLRILASYSVTLPLLAATFTYLLLVLQTGSSGQRVEQLANLLTARQAELINSRMHQLQQRVATHAQAEDPASWVSLERAEARLRTYFPEAVGLRLVPLGPLGIADKDNEALNTLRSHVELDMIRRASQDHAGITDAYQAGNDWLVSVAQPVADAGVLLVSFPAGLLRQWLAPTPNNDAQSEIVQRFLNQNNVIASNRIAQPADITYSRQLDIEGWYVRVTPSQELVERFGEENVPLLIVCLLSIITAVFNVVFGLRSSRQLNDALEQSSLSQAFEQPSQPKETPAAERGAEPGDSPDRQLDMLLMEVEELPVAEVGIQGEQVPAERQPAAVSGAAAAHKAPPAINAMPLREDFHAPHDIFRAYDIRGLADTQLTSELCQLIGRALGSEFVESGQPSVLVGRDGRNSSPRVRDDVVVGLRAAGADVIDLGLLPTPVLHFACYQLGVGNAVMVTGSHNGKEYNGLKMLQGRQVLTDTAIKQLERRIEERRFTSGEGGYRSATVVDQYIERISSDIAVARTIKVVVDAGNGITGPLAPRLFSDMGFRVEPLFCDVDGDFPNHPPDPTVESNLDALKAAVRARRADLGVALDGDGDRLAVVTARGRALAADQLLMILARDVVTRIPGAEVLFDVKCSRNLPRLIGEIGGRPTMAKSGHSFMKLKMAETGAPLGGEFSGHIFFNERWFGFDDGMYVAARLMEIMSMHGLDLDEELDLLPASFATPEILIPVADSRKFDIVDRVVAANGFHDATINTLDGVRAEFADGWGLVRASNTVPALTLRFEADTEQALARIQENFRKLLTTIDSELDVGF